MRELLRMATMVDPGAARVHAISMCLSTQFVALLSKLATEANPRMPFSGDVERYAPQTFVIVRKGRSDSPWLLSPRSIAVSSSLDWYLDKWGHVVGNRRLRGLHENLVAAHAKS